MIAFVIALLLILIVLGLPIALALLASSIVFFLLSDIPGTLLVQQMLGGTSSFVLVAIPLFVFAGQLMNNGGITRRIIRFCNALIGRSPGGLAQVNVLSNMVFAGISGEAVADTAGLGSVLIPAMRKQGYSKEFSAGITAAASVAGPIIPPSIPMIICASMAQVSVGKMFLGGAIPGLLFVVASLVYTYYLAVQRKFPRGESFTFSELRAAFLDAFWALLAPVIIVGGLVSGVFTVSEAAVIAVLYVFVVGKFIYKEIDLKRVVSEGWYTVSLTGAIMIILATAKIYTYALTVEQIAQVLTHSLAYLTSDAHVLFLLLLLVALIIGSFLSTTAGLLLMVPLLGPLVTQTAMDAVQFYVLITISLCIGTLTPPVGITLFLASSLGEASPEKVFMETVPYILLLLAIIVAAMFLPGIVMWLPNLVYGG